MNNDLAIIFHYKYFGFIKVIDGICHLDSLERTENYNRLDNFKRRNKIKRLFLSFKGTVYELKD